MRHESILVVGGSGFIGGKIVARLAAEGRRVVVPTRRRERARQLILLPTVDVVETSVSDPAALSALVASCDAVINLVGVLHGRAGRADDPYGPDFTQAHVELPGKLVDACRQHGVRRLLHMSALGVTDGGRHSLPSRYLRSKAAGEEKVRQAKDLDWTIFRPSVVFGPGDRFLTLFARLQRVLPVVALPNAESRFQPVYVGDVAQAFVNALDSPATHHGTYPLAGPRVYTLRQLVTLAGKWSGHQRPVIALPGRLARLQAALMELAPGGPLLSRDNLDSMTIDNVSARGIDPALGVTPTPLEAIGPSYLRPPARRRDSNRQTGSPG
jgi:uncharacterized protein YbjT (DUF2867 family)